MTWWQILLIVVAAIVLLILLLPIGVDFKKSGDNISLTARAGFIKLKLFPVNKKKKKTPSEKKERPDKKKSRKRTLTFSQTIELIKSGAKSIKSVIKAVNISKFDCHIIVGFPGDSVKTALCYGTACACVSSVMPLLEEGGLKKYDVSVDSDFDNPTTSDADVRARALLCVFIIIFFILLLKFLKLRMRQKREVRK